MKRYLAVILTLITVLCLAACGSGTQTASSAGSQSADSQQESAPTETEQIKSDVPTEYKSALIKAKSYSDSMHMSKLSIYDQLTSEYGEKFSAEAAQYAVDNLNADWNANALAKAEDYQNTMNMSPASIHDQLTSSYGEKFTEEQADYAIANLK